MLVTVYLALVIAYYIYAICECSWRVDEIVDKMVIAGLLIIVAVMCVRKLFV